MKKRRVHVIKNHSLLIEGPVYIRLISGKISIFSCPIKIDETIIVERYRQTSIHAEKDSIVEIIDGSSTVEEVDGSTIPESWVNLTQEIKKKNVRKIVILGDVDVGKSTLCTYIINNLLYYHPKVFAIDSDIGQSEIGPPTTIGWGSTSTPIKFNREIKSELTFFIGDKSPYSHENEILHGIDRIFSVINRENHSIIVNTDGWLEGQDALRFKLDFINLISPNLVVTLGVKAEKIIDHIKFPVIKLKSSVYTFRKNFLQRKRIRESGFYRFLKNGSVSGYDTDKIYMDDDLLKFKEDGLVNLLVGLLDENEWLINIGVIIGVSADRKKLYVYSRMDRPVCKVVTGFIKITKTGKEIDSKEWTH